MTTVSAWYNRRPYIHFDLPLSEKDATNYVSDPDLIAQYPFYPLLTYEILTPRIRKAPPGSGKALVNSTKARKISYPAHKDGYIFSYYKSILQPLYEEWIQHHGLGQAVTAYRSNGENNVTLPRKPLNLLKNILAVE